MTTSCNGFTCDTNGKDCRTRCTSPSDCAKGFVCSSDKCIRLAGACSADGVEVVAADGSTTTCAPFRCRDGACLSACESSADCGPGTVCDLGSKACATAPPAEGDDGGCAVSGVGRSVPSSLAAFAMALAAIARRRRPRV
jgi:MYXO-CTERM domain-containing protein